MTDGGFAPPAADTIGHMDGAYKGDSAPIYKKYKPMPYNMAVRMFGGLNDYIVIPHNPGVFNQTNSATIEMWLRLTTFCGKPVLFSKGSSAENVSFVYYVSEEGRLGLTLGSGTTEMNGDRQLPLNEWAHVAVSWSTNDGGKKYNITFYVNGAQVGYSTSVPGPFRTNTNQVWIGKAQSLPSRPTPNGWLDEVRFWSGDFTPTSLRRIMFASGRALDGPPSGKLLGMWNFDGNLICHKKLALSGSFNNGKDNNNARFSGYRNETTAGALGPKFEAHPTVINRVVTWGNNTPSFPTQFIMADAPFWSIPNGHPGGIESSISVQSPGVAKDVEVFVSIAHPLMQDVVMSLKAPNGEVRYLLGHDGAGSHVLSFFGDGLADSPSTDYPPPLELHEAGAVLRHVRQREQVGGLDAEDYRRQRVERRGPAGVGNPLRQQLINQVR